MDSAKGYFLFFPNRVVSRSATFLVFGFNAPILSERATGLLLTMLARRLLSTSEVRRLRPEVDEAALSSSWGSAVPTLERRGTSDRGIR